MTEVTWRRQQDSRGGAEKPEDHGGSRIQEVGLKSQRTKARGAVRRNTVALLPPGGCGMLGPQRGKKRVGWPVGSTLQRSFTEGLV